MSRDRRGRKTWPEVERRATDHPYRRKGEHSDAWIIFWTCSLLGAFLASPKFLEFLGY